MKTKTFYKKIVTYTKNKEGDGSLGIGLFFLGAAFGYIWGASLPEYKIGFLSYFILFGIGYIILNYYITHRREVKYEKYEVKQK